MEQVTKDHDKIRIVCPKCKTVGSIPAKRIQGGNLKFRCAKCGESFPYLHERREYFRKAPLPHAKYGPFDFDFDKLWGEANIVDLSMTGMKLSVDQLPLDEHLGIAFNLPPLEDTIKVGGKVVWHKPLDEGGYNIGIRFTHVDHHSKKLIGFFLMG